MKQYYIYGNNSIEELANSVCNTITEVELKYLHAEYIREGLRAIVNNCGRRMAYEDHEMYRFAFLQGLTLFYQKTELYEEDEECLDRKHVVILCNAMSKALSNMRPKIVLINGKNNHSCLNILLSFFEDGKCYPHMQKTCRDFFKLVLEELE